MKNPITLIFTITCLLLSGCSDNSELERLKEENEELKSIVQEYNELKKVQQQENEKKKEKEAQKEIFKTVLINAFKNQIGYPWNEHYHIKHSQVDSEYSEYRESEYLVKRGFLDKKYCKDAWGVDKYWCYYNPTSKLNILDRGEYSFVVKVGLGAIDEINSIDYKDEGKKVVINFSTQIQNLTDLGKLNGLSEFGKPNYYENESIRQSVSVEFFKEHDEWHVRDWKSIFKQYCDYCAKHY